MTDLRDFSTDDHSLRKTQTLPTTHSSRFFQAFQTQPAKIPMTLIERAKVAIRNYHMSHTIMHKFEKAYGPALFSEPPNQSMRFIGALKKAVAERDEPRIERLLKMPPDEPVLQKILIDVGLVKNDQTLSPTENNLPPRMK